LTLRNSTPLSLHVPVPLARPGETPDFSGLVLPKPGETPRPEIDANPAAMRDLAFSLIRVMDDKGGAIGPWNPGLPTDFLVSALRTMVRIRAFDDRMFRLQRQGKTSFYMKCTGEEAIAVAQTLQLDRQDMTFPTYRQQGILFARDCPMFDMMCQIFSNSRDPLKGRQLPVLYSFRDYGYFTISGNLATQFSQAVGWAMASAYKSDDKICSAWIGDGSTAEGDFHYALTFASTYRAPVILNVVNNQWAISTFTGIASGDAETLASRALGYGIPALRVDGNDFLAVSAASAWAVERARANLGPTLIEHVTYRAEGHSTSDDPSKYRPQDEAISWPLGDPIFRLRDHLIAGGALTAEAFETLKTEADTEVRAALKEAESFGTLGNTEGQDIGASMFDDVYAQPDWRLREQLLEAGTR
jgi:2-oxoisovalerate dehydrogenase E1 component alpha subunit